MIRPPWPRGAPLLLLILLVSPASCGGDGDSGGDGGADGGGAGTDGGDSADAGPDEHAFSQALVMVTEQHVTGPTMFQNGFALASIMPLLSEQGYCYEWTVYESGGCKVTEVVQPICEPSCGADEFCYADPGDSCRTSCRPACTRECPEGELCRFTDDGQMTCEPQGDFGGVGAITLSGLTQPVTLEPPSSSTVTVMGSVFTDSPVTATAPGSSSESGLGGFEVTIAPPPIPVASPPLASLTSEDFAGTLTLTWSAGEDVAEIEFFASGSSGAYTNLRCEASDASGQHTIPGNAFHQFPIDTQVVRVDLKRRRDAAVEVDTFGTYAGLPLPSRGEALLRLQRLETATIAF